MRDPHAPVWTKSAVFAAAVLFEAIGLTSRAAAQAKFDRLFVFGDSYADLTLSDRPASNPLAPPGLKLNFWRVYPVSLAQNLGIPGTLITDVTVGGATADPKLGKPDPGIAPGIGRTCRSRFKHFLVPIPRSARAIWRRSTSAAMTSAASPSQNTPAQNLALGYPATITPANAKEFADKTTEFATMQIGLLQDAGARNFTLTMKHDQ
jgi:phospholipase/lecithinase/hemolysin